MNSYKISWSPKSYISVKGDFIAIKTSNDSPLFYKKVCFILKFSLDKPGMYMFEFRPLAKIYRNFTD